MSLFTERFMDQQSKIDELQQKLADASMTGISALADRENLIHQVNHLNEELTRLRAENEALRKDKERAEGLLEAQRIDLEKVGPEFKRFWKESYKSPVYWQELATLAMEELKLAEAQK